MPKSSRYLLIFLGFVIFFVLAPAIAFFSAGLSLDIQNGQIIKTGILTFKTDPKKLDVFLDGKKINSPGENLRFLKPKDYSLRLEKEGYCAWEKKLRVNPGEVTWASPFNSKIFLLKNMAEPKIFSTSTLDFLYKNELVYVLKSGELETYSTKNQKLDSAAVSDRAEKIYSLDGGDKMLIAAASSGGPGSLLIFDAKNKKTADISELFSGLPKILSSNGDLFALFGQNLYLLNIKEKIPDKKLLLGEVLDFELAARDGYVLVSNKTGSGLFTFSQDSPDQLTKLAVLPQFKQANLFVTDQRQIFILADGKLYQVGLEIKDLGFVSEIEFNKSEPSLIFFGQGETDFFDFYANRPKLISRTSQAIKNPLLADNLGYAFWQKNNLIEALELDSRDAQNSCPLYNGREIKKIMAGENNRLIFVLDGEDLKMLEIR